MKKTIGIIVLLLTLPFMGAVVSCWVGNIVLPEMGLHAPGYWTWLKTGFVITGSYVFVGFLKGILKEIEWIGKD
jgi:hypothetical protein